MSGTAAWAIATNEQKPHNVRRTFAISVDSSTGRKAVAAAFATRMSTRPKARDPLEDRADLLGLGEIGAAARQTHRDAPPDAPETRR